jgi:phage baseplate assembly protein gpV
MTNAPPSANPADVGSLQGLLRVFGQKLAQNTDDMLPARVVAYDRATNRATVQPLVQMVTTQGERIARAQIPSVPVFQYGGGGFVIAFPLAPGDLGWIKASDRDIGLVLQTLGEAEPNTARTHSFQDGMFYPDVLRQWTLDEADADRLVIQSTDGATRIAVGADIVAVTSSGSVTVEAEGLEATVSTANIAASTAINLTSPTVTVTGNLVVTGTLSAAGGITGAGGLEFETHTHGGVTAGAANTGAPNP